MSGLDKPKMSSLLRQSVSRINIHRGKKLNGIAKKKDDICKHLESGNEVNAKIWCETLINEEALLPCYDIIAIMCDQINGKLSQIVKFGPPKDLDQTFRTIIHAAPKMDVDELSQVRAQLGKLLGKEFVKQSDIDYSSINKVIAENIDIKVPEEGQVIRRLVELAKERNISYKPSYEAVVQLNDYCVRKDILNPLDGHHGQAQQMQQPPAYNPAAFQQAPTGGPPFNQPPPGGNFYQPPPGSGGPGGAGGYSYMQQPPSYQPQPGAYTGIGSIPAYNPPSQNFDSNHSLPPSSTPVLYPDVNVQDHSNQNINSNPYPGAGPAFTIPDYNSAKGMGGGQPNENDQIRDDVSTTSHNTLDDLESRLAALKKF